MASIFKRGGRANRDGPWWIAYFERPGLRRTVRGCNDKAATQAMARKLEDNARLRRQGVDDPKVQALAAAQAVPLADHVADFRQWLEGRDVTAGHVDTTAARVTHVLDACGAKRINDLTISRVQEALSTLRAGGMALRTLTGHVRAVKQFGKWLALDGRARDNPVAHLAGFNAETDRRRVRRILSDDDLRELVAAAMNDGTVGGMAGPDRAVCYLTAISTGFRRSELGSLTPESFALDAAPPAITVRAGYSKRRREDRQPVPVALANMLRPWLAEKPAGERVFPLGRSSAAMLRHDLAAAGLTYETVEGFFDWHSFRHGYVTRLALSPLPLKLVQSLSRHSTPVLTLNCYTHVDEALKGAAVAALPLLGSGEGSLGRTAHGTAVCAHEGARRGTTHHDGERDAARETLDTEGVEVVTSQALGATCPDIAQHSNADMFTQAGVAERQTRWIQNPVMATS